MAGMKPYGHQWRTRTRPAILERDEYLCRRCRCGGRLDIAHLDGDNTHDEDRNLAAFCRACHVRIDFPVAQAKARATRAERKDRGRPLLAYS